MHPKWIGCILRLTQEWAYLLTCEQFVLLEELDAFNNREAVDKNFQSNLIEFAKIKGLANKTRTELDRYLNQEEAVVPKTVRLRLRESGDGVEIIPDVEGVDSEQFEAVFDKFPNSEGIYNLSLPDGGRTRVLFQEEQRDALQTVKRYRQVSREHLSEIAKQPQTYFDPEIIELDGFSERVRKIGIYQPRVYPFVSPYKSEWIPGILVEDANGERAKIEVKNDQELAELKNLIAQAKQNGQNDMTWNGVQLPVAEVEQHLPFIEGQLRDPRIPPHVRDEKFDDVPVLIIRGEHRQIQLCYRPHLILRSRNRFDIYLTLRQISNRNLNSCRTKRKGLRGHSNFVRRNIREACLPMIWGLAKRYKCSVFLEWHHAKYNPQQPYLIVAPIALLENWQAEYPKFF